jgi:hypothetical protein
VGELARGRVADRPWGRTFATVGLRGVTGQLTLVSDARRFLVAFEHGAVVAAVSPLASDAAVRVALTSHLVSSSQVPEIARRQAAAPERDEIDLIAELARLGPDHALRLRRRVIAQRAARTFSISHGEFIVAGHTELPILPGCALDVRAVTYMGARTNLSEQRLSAELDQLGSWFQLKPALDEDLPQFGFTDLEQPVIERLRAGGTVAEIEEFATSFVDARTVRAVVYSLAAYHACEALPPRPSAGAPAAARTNTQPLPRIAPPTASEASRAAGPTPGSPMRRPLAVAPEPPASTPPELPRQTTVPLPAAPPRPTASPPRLATGSAALPPLEGGLDPPGQGDGASPGMRPPVDARPRDGSDPGMRPPFADRSPEQVILQDPPSRPPPRSRPRTDSPQARDVTALIAQRLELLAHGADHFALLGVGQDVSPEVLRGAYFALARQLHPDRLTALGISDDGKHAQRLFAQINAGFAILSDQARRAQYLQVVRRGGEAAVRAEQERAEELAQRILEAEEAFRRGELAIKRDQPGAAVAELERAIQLDPGEADYHALLAWSRFCAAPDKLAVAAATRMALDKAILRSPKAVTARFYLGRVERMLGRDQEALRHFRDVLAAAPGHADAAAELRVLEARLAGGDRPGSGLFGRPKR